MKNFFQELKRHLLLEKNKQRIFKVQKKKRKLKICLKLKKQRIREKDNNEKY